MRYSLPNSRIMVHQPSGQASGQATDILIQVESAQLGASFERSNEKEGFGHRVLNDLQRTRLSRRCMIWLLPSPLSSQ
jgi:hypothetical protein